MLWETHYDPANPDAAFAAMVDAWQNPENKVFALRGSSDGVDVKDYFTAHFDKIGKPCPLAEDVTAGDRMQQRTGDIWMEVRYDPKHPDAYRHSANAQPLHTDGSYIPTFPNATLMVCVANAGEGGETTFIDGKDVVGTLAVEAPDLLEALTARDIPHARSGDKREEKVIDHVGGSPRMNWNYYCVDPEVDQDGRELADRYFEFLQNSPGIREKIIPVKLSPGDAVAWKDQYVLHGRNGFVANHESERFIWKCAIDVGNFED
jgi:alpha-ketoglutarate-dependent taurine dioxygenase